MNLYEFLEKYKVIIPIIQRDYAQGRKGEEIKRSRILDDIKKVLDGSKTELDMDFVYGEEKEKETKDEKTGERIKEIFFFPLDGQQRLTTLWLVHWYVYFNGFDYMTEAIEDKYDILGHFSYQTRDSSEEFCQCMCEEEYLADMKKAKDSFPNLSELIRSRTWFLTEWLNDPTIDAMLRTLSGDKESHKDCIESILGYDSTTKAKEAVERLDNITFELKPIGDKELPDEAADDLYIKMNSRGKPLSDFENFKSDLVSNLLSELPNGNDFAVKIDKDWTDVFWKEVKNEERKEFDPMFFSFINRYVVNAICLPTENEPSASEYRYSKETADSKGKDIQSFYVLSGAGLAGNSPDDSKVQYKEYEHYKPYLDKNVLNNFEAIFLALSDEEILKCIKKEWNDIDEDYSFIPQYVYDEVERRSKTERTKLEERVYFYATCRYIEINKELLSGNKNDWIENYHHWMRVIHNLARNYYFNEVTDLISCIRLIRTLIEHVQGDEIYRCLAETDRDDLEQLYADDPKATDNDSEDNDKPVFKNKKQRFWEQLVEEQEKATILINNEQLTSMIEEAENFSFFDGTIRFLYRDNEGKPIKDHLEAALERRFKKSKDLFDSDKDHPVKVATVQKLLRQFNTFDDIIDEYVFTSQGHSDITKVKTWKRDILCNPDLKKQVLNLFEEEKDTINAKDAHEEFYKDFVDSEKLIESLLKKNKYRLIATGETADIYRLSIANAGNEKRKETDIYLFGKDFYEENKELVKGEIEKIGATGYSKKRRDEGNTKDELERAFFS